MGEGVPQPTIAHFKESVCGFSIFTKQNLIFFINSVNTKVNFLPLCKYFEVAIFQHILLTTDSVDTVIEFYLLIP